MNPTSSTNPTNPTNSKNPTNSIRVPILDLVRQYESIREEMDVAILEVVRSGRFILGPFVERFEERAAGYCGVKHAIGVASGTDALLLSLRALEIGPGDGVILPSFTFFATAGVVHNVGATPVFADIDPKTFNLDPDHLRSIHEDAGAARGKWPVASRDYESGDTGARVPSTNHTPQATDSALRIKAVIPVHLYGQMADMDEIMAVADEFGLAVIEDAAQAIGAEYFRSFEHVARGPWHAEEAPFSDGSPHKPQATSHQPPSRKAGAIGHLGCFSFYPTKNLGAYGDGGMITTDDDELADKLRLLRVHGARPKYFHKMVGINSRLDAIQAAILSVKLRYLDEWSAARARIADRYDELLSDADGIVTPFRVEDRTHIFHQYTIRVPDGRRDALRKHMQDQGIGTMIYYPKPLHLQECFAGLGYREGQLPESESASREVLSLPIFPELTEEEQTYVADAIREFVS